MTVVFNVINAFWAVGAMGLLLGIGLAVASRILSVKKDERIQEIENSLPGLNCGACGYAGCAAYAEAIIKGNGNEPLSRCTPGGPSVAKKLSVIMGVEAHESGQSVRKIAQIHCRGKIGITKESFEYKGLADCNALHILYGGNKECKYACLGLGSCIRICPVNAISYDPEGCVWVDKDLCISCGKCITICPTGVIHWIPYDADYIVACSNHDKGASVRKYCEVGCIGCKICEKKSSEGGFIVEDNLARIDYAEKGDRKDAAIACPPQTIINTGNQTVKPKEAAGKSIRKEEQATGQA